MKVLYCHQYFTTPSQGGGTRSYEFAQHLIRKGHQVTMVCGESVKLNLPESSVKGIFRGVVDGIDVIQVAVPSSNYDSIVKRVYTFVKFAWLSIKVVLKEDFDILFATSTPLTAGIPGIVMKCFRKKKFVFEVRDLWPELPKALGMKNPFLLAGMSVLEWMSYHLADACIGLSPGICEGITRRSQKGKKIVMIPNGCDLEIFKPITVGKDTLILEDLEDDDVVAIFTGAHGIANGLDAILDVASVLKSRNRTNIKLVFVGDGKMKPHLMERVAKEKLDNCRFYSSMPKKELNSVISRADIGLMVLANIPAFYYGTSPNKFFDYISAGLPVLINYPGWLADMIQENNLGVVVPADNPQAFADGLISLLDDNNFKIQCGKNARTFAETHFSRELLADRFVTFLEEVSLLK